MTQKEKKSCPVVLCIAGSDSSAGAGIQADIKTVAALGGFAATAITVVTAQSSKGLQGSQAITRNLLRSQIESVFETYKIGAIKIGLLAGKTQVKEILSFLKILDEKPPVILDPVTKASNGALLTHLEEVRDLMPELFSLVDLITPNRPELVQLIQLAGRMTTNALAEKIVKANAENFDEPEFLQEIASAMGGLGSRGFLLKAGHIGPKKSKKTKTAPQLIDRLFLPGPDEEKWQIDEFSHRYLKNTQARGTGCSLSSAIAFFMANGYSIRDSVGKAINYLAEILAAPPFVASPNRPLDHFSGSKAPSRKE